MSDKEDKKPDPSHPSSIPAISTALLVCDYQNYMLTTNSGLTPTDLTPFLHRGASVIQACRSKGIHIIYVVCCFRPGAIDISPANKNFGFIRSKGLLVEGTQEAKVHGEVSGQEGDFVVVTRRMSAFTGSDLFSILYSLSVKHLLVMGVPTSGVVLSTVRDASDRDFIITVISDCCVDPDSDVHNTLIEKVLPYAAYIATAEQVEDSLKVSTSGSTLSSPKQNSP